VSAWKATDRSKPPSGAILPTIRPNPCERSDDSALCQVVFRRVLRDEQIQRLDQPCGAYSCLEELRFPHTPDCTRIGGLASTAHTPEDVRRALGFVCVYKQLRPSGAAHDVGEAAPREHLLEDRWRAASRSSALALATAVAGDCRPIPSAQASRLSDDAPAET